MVGGRGLYIATALLAVLLTACSQAGESPLPGRWYSQAQLDSGRALFVANCAGCHHEDASGTLEWKRRLPDGTLPPPPLNGTAHAWHHDIDTLERTIEHGGVPLGGSMPAFGALLDRSQRLAVIAYFQSFWADDVYALWQERNR